MKLDFSRPFILDGATGTELQKLGLQRGACPEAWVLENPNAIKTVQRAYSDAGSNCVYAPTFGANRVTMKKYGITRDINEFCKELVSLSREAVAPNVLVAGDIAPCGLSLLPYGTASFGDLIDVFEEQAAALERAGVDLYAIETQMTIPEAKAALIAVRRVSDKPVLVSFACNDSGRSVMGADLTAAMLALQDFGLDAYGINCCGNMDLLCRLLGNMREYSRLPLIAKPNAGMPDMSSGSAVYGMTPADFAAASIRFVEAGASLLGGCCGTHSAHIAALSRAVNDMATLSPAPKEAAVAASQTLICEITDSTVIVEAEINDDLQDSMEEIAENGAEVMRLHIRDEADIETIDDCQYGLSLPLAVSFEDDSLRDKFAFAYHGKAHII